MYGMNTDNATKLAVAGMGYYGAQKRNVAQRRQAEELMDWQADMSNTAYQRAMVDMKSSGLNPILAGKIGGAGTPIGAMAQIQDPIGAGITSGLEASKAGADVNLSNARTALTEADTTLKKTLIPSAQTLEVLTKRGLQLVTALDELVASYKPNYKETLDDVKNKVGEVIIRGQKISSAFGQGLLSGIADLSLGTRNLVKEILKVTPKSKLRQPPQKLKNYNPGQRQSR